MNIEKALQKHRDRLLRLPNVSGVGIGEKDGTAVILVFVKEKLAESRLRPNEIVPRALEGHRTDVCLEVRVGFAP